MAEQQSVDIFEVFKLDAIKKTELEALPLDEAKKRFVRLVPVTSTDELKNATAVASVPPPNHMVVDRNKFQGMFKQQSTDAINKKTSGLLNRLDRTVVRLKSEFQTEWKNSLDLLKENVTFHQADCLRSVKAAVDGESDPVKRAEQIENAFKSQEEQLNKLFALLEAKRSFIDQLTLDEDESPIDADLLLGANPDQQ
jgi:hypothetical protein